VDGGACRVFGGAKVTILDMGVSVGEVRGGKVATGTLDQLSDILNARMYTITGFKPQQRAPKRVGVNERDYAGWTAVHAGCLGGRR